MKLKNQGKLNYRIWRIDPHRRAIAPLLLDAKKKDFGLEIQRMIRADVLGHIILGDINGVSLAVAGDASAEKGQPGFQLTGFGEPTSGIGVLFGSINGGLTEAPITREWLDLHLVWTDADETDAEEADA
jgi:hypothetical protein